MRRVSCSGAGTRPRAGTHMAVSRPGTCPARESAPPSRPDPDPGAGDLSLGLHAQREHQLLVPVSVKVNRPTGVWSPQLDAVVLKQGLHRDVLAAVERSLILATTIASNPRSGWPSPPAARPPAGGAPTAVPGFPRHQRTSATIRPRPAISAPAWSRCRAGRSPDPASPQWRPGRKKRTAPRPGAAAQPGGAPSAVPTQADDLAPQQDC